MNLWAEEITHTYFEEITYIFMGNLIQTWWTNLVLQLNDSEPGPCEETTHAFCALRYVIFQNNRQSKGEWKPVIFELYCKYDIFREPWMGKILETITRGLSDWKEDPNICWDHQWKAAKHRSQESLFPPYRGVSITGTLFLGMWKQWARQRKLGQPLDLIF